MVAGHFVTSNSLDFSGDFDGQARDGYPEPIVTHLQNPVNSFLAGDYPLFILVKPVVERHEDKEKERGRDPALFGDGSDGAQEDGEGACRLLHHLHDLYLAAYGKVIGLAGRQAVTGPQDGRQSRKGGCLSGGEQKMLAIVRALMGNPELLLLDEPTEGLAPMLVRALEQQIKKLRETGLTVLLAEQNVRSALRLGDRGYIIDNGQIRYQGSIEELKENEEVRRKYLLV